MIQYPRIAIALIIGLMSFGNVFAEENPTTEVAQPQENAEQATEQATEQSPEQLQEEIKAANAEIAYIRKKIELERARQEARLLQVKLLLERNSVEQEYQDAGIEKNIKNTEAKTKRLQQQVEETLLQAEIRLITTREELQNIVQSPITYTKTPFKDGVLTISDRRISLDGPIAKGSGEMISNKINYFNNQSTEYPIFIVINSSPGGSVMEGYHILEAMRASRAPVHVVVKNYAASMAAAITTLAEHSYVYPNAIILHHQMSYGMQGNITDQEEALNVSKEWEKRLMTLIVKKMGITIEEFKKQMYEHAKSGDWEEFGDKAVALKWANNVVASIREEGVRRLPEDPSSRVSLFSFLKEEIDAEGKSFIRLPKLDPFDFYFLYNKNGYYRMQK